MTASNLSPHAAACASLSKPPRLVTRSAVFDMVAARQAEAAAPRSRGLGWFAGLARLGKQLLERRDSATLTDPWAESLRSLSGSSRHTPYVASFRPKMVVLQFAA